MVVPCLEPRTFPKTLESRYGLSEFISRCASHFACDNPLAEIPTPLHLFERMANQRPNEVCLMWPNVEHNSYDKITYAQTRDYCCRLLTYLKSSFLEGVEAGETVAVLANDNAGMFFLLLALYWGDYVTLLLSTRNSESAIRSMCVEAQVKVIVSSYPQLTKDLTGDNIRVCEYFKITTDFLSSLPMSEVQALPKYANSNPMEQIRFILHSSGSTRFPSLIRMPNRCVYVNGMVVHNWSRSSDFVSLNIGPIYHAMAFISTFCAFLCGATTASFPLGQSYPPRPSEIMRSIRLLNPNRVSTVPAILQAVCDFAKFDRSGTEWETLREVPLVTYAGAPILPSTADLLHQHQVNLKSDYGTTEVGAVMRGLYWMPEARCTKLVLSPEASYTMVESSENPGSYELIILKDSITMAAVDWNHPLGYSTKDLFATTNEEGVYEYLERYSDTLVHLNAEKTNALQLEIDITQHYPLIDQVAVCGSGKSSTSALIQLKWDQVLAAHRTFNEVLAAVQLAVQQANNDAPSHSRIAAQSVFCLLPGVSLPATDKGNVSRPKAQEMFEDLIDSASSRNAVSSGAQSSKKAFRPMTSMIDKKPLKLTEEELARTMALLLSELVELPLEEILEQLDKNFLDYGVTSQMTAQLHPALEKLLESEVAPTLPYEFPTLRSLTRACLQLQNEDFAREQDEAVVKSLIASYKAAIDAWASCIALLNPVPETPAPHSDRKQVFLVTGVSGGLGIELARVLSTNPRVSKVVCLLRGADPMRRLRDVATEKAVTDLIDWAKIEVHNYNMKDQFLGMDPATYRDVRNQTTDVIHNAWRLNFNHGVDQYAKDCLPSVLNLIKFCSATSVKKSLTFISSISAVGKCPLAPEAAFVPEVHIQSFDWVMPFGYAHSKYVAENMCLYAAKTLGLRANIVRCGQLSGARHGGVWNTKDFFSLLIRGGAQDLKKMPATKYPADIVPMDVAAGAVVDIVNSTPDKQVYHIANPYGANWDLFLDLLRENGLSFEVVDHEQFYLAVKQQPENPCCALLPWLYGDIQSKDQFLGSLDCSNTLDISYALNNCPPVASDLVRIYVDQWRSVGFLRT
eukprot:Gregarina_sp_Pseudo_9__1698@NODE_214_length_3581_cov_13_939864_g199_i0_p1_GENE_NODE_214_length_3581_cov_13_939864_g199_i0NODE_214_length_3581_cov_13_939864_g199_i0_p1_ORF_typecomplete_len1082_score191_50NAD_binding_4/PF07993_12/6_1e43AMPbinding/PF00501_28/1e34Epimerase/PF01370_21/9_7e143Beta_HSD/PF01073_19/6_7e06GDP_Man_Dehyd/PF16363_5/9_7e05PPbinding/PF00550_25/0_00027RmlD_sub_bind/PF04321_17/0_0015adh_short/PF00106_25/0_053KR/PF08659_10/0_19_NODE_214_length_3581_cov_13_939864_g199_i02313476